MEVEAAFCFHKELNNDNHQRTSPVCSCSTCHDNDEAVEPALMESKMLRHDEARRRRHVLGFS